MPDQGVTGFVVELLQGGRCNLQVPEEGLGHQLTGPIVQEGQNDFPHDGNASHLAPALLVPRAVSAKGSGQFRGLKFLLQEILGEHQEGDSHQG